MFFWVAFYHAKKTNRTKKSCHSKTTFKKFLVEMSAKAGKQTFMIGIIVRASIPILKKFIILDHYWPIYSLFKVGSQKI